METLQTFIKDRKELDALLNILMQKAIDVSYPLSVIEVPLKELSAGLLEEIKKWEVFKVMIVDYEQNLIIVRPTTKYCATEKERREVLETFVSTKDLELALKDYTSRDPITSKKLMDSCMKKLEDGLKELGNKKGVKVSRRDLQRLSQKKFYFEDKESQTLIFMRPFLEKFKSGGRVCGKVKVIKVKWVSQQKGLVYFRLEFDISNVLVAVTSHLLERLRERFFKTNNITRNKLIEYFFETMCENEGGILHDLGNLRIAIEFKSGVCYGIVKHEFVQAETEDEKDFNIELFQLKTFMSRESLSEWQLRSLEQSKKTNFSFKKVLV